MRHRDRQTRARCSTPQPWGSALTTAGQRLLDRYLGQKFWLSRAAVPGMLKRGWGPVLFATSDIARGTQANPLGAVAMSGGIGMMRDLGAQPRGGLLVGGIPEEEELARHHLTVPEFIAPMITWLCTDAAANVTGEVFSLNGGVISRWSQLEDASTVVRVQAGGPALWTLWTSSRSSTCSRAGPDLLRSRLGSRSCRRRG